jgi:hypothetical protein
MGPKFGAGFSRVLSKLDKPEFLDMLIQKNGPEGIKLVDRIKDELNSTNSLSNGTSALWNNQIL